MCYSVFIHIMYEYLGLHISVFMIGTALIHHGCAFCIDLYTLNHVPTASLMFYFRETLVPSWL